MPSRRIGLARFAASVLCLSSFSSVALGQAAPPETAPSEPAATGAAPPAEPPPSHAPPAPAPAASAPPAAPAPVPFVGWQPATAAPSEPVADRTPEAPLPPPGPPGWQAWMGIRTTYISSSGYDPFSTDDASLQGSLGISRRIFESSPLSFAAGAMFDLGTGRASARGAPTTLQTYRVLLAPEIRWHLLPVLYVFGRPSAGIVRTSASIDEGTTGVTLYSRAWLAAVDLDAGAAVAFWDLRKQAGDLRFWLVADGGYAWAQEQKLAMAPDADSGAPERTANLDLGSLALRGPFFRGAIAATF
jgi:hypothetical protein